MHLRLRCAFRNAQDVRDLAVLQTLDVVQDERRAAAGGQLRERALQVDPSDGLIAYPVTQRVSDD